MVKKQFRGLMTTLPFTYFLWKLNISMVQFVTMWINAFPSKTRISNRLTHRELVCRHKLDTSKHCKTPLGTYCKVHDKTAPTNSMVSRTRPAIAMGTNGNLQGS